MAKKVTLLVGTKKGLYILRGDAGRGSWACEGPQFAPAEIHHAAYDPRDGSMFAAVNQTWGGSRIEVSRDMGKTWKTTKNPAFPEGGDRTFSKTWHIEPGHEKTPNVVGPYCAFAAWNPATTLARASSQVAGRSGASFESRTRGWVSRT